MAPRTAPPSRAQPRNGPQMFQERGDSCQRTCNFYSFSATYFPLIRIECLNESSIRPSSVLCFCPISFVLLCSTNLNRCQPRQAYPAVTQRLLRAAVFALLDRIKTWRHTNFSCPSVLTARAYALSLLLKSWRSLRLSAQALA